MRAHAREDLRYLIIVSPRKTYVNQNTAVIGDEKRRLGKKTQRKDGWPCATHTF